MKKPTGPIYETEKLPGLFNLYTRAHRGLVFSARMRVIRAMTEAMLKAEARSAKGKKERL
jgi:hypothetical protein